jgi:hypothetical protein
MNILSKRRKQQTIPTDFDMSINDIGEGELEGIVSDPEIVVHAQNRPTLIRKAERELREKHSISRPVVRTKVPSGKAGNKF